jgi:hypothetical protein
MQKTRGLCHIHSLASLFQRPTVFSDRRPEQEYRRKAGIQRKGRITEGRQKYREKVIMKREGKVQKVGGNAAEIFHSINRA